MHVIFNPGKEDLYVLQRGGSGLGGQFWSLLENMYDTTKECMAARRSWETTRKVGPGFVCALLELRKTSFRQNRVPLLDNGIYRVNTKAKDVVHVSRESSGEESLHINHYAHAVDGLLDLTKNEGSSVGAHDIRSAVASAMTGIKANIPLIVSVESCDKTSPELFVLFMDSAMVLADPSDVLTYLKKELNMRSLQIVHKMEWSHEYSEYMVHVGKMDAKVKKKGLHDKA